MVTFSNCAKSSDKVIARSVLVVERLVTEPMSKRVDTECRLSVSVCAKVVKSITYMVNENESSGTGKEESTSPVSPSESSNHGRESETHKQEKGKIVLVLPFDNSVPGQIRDIRYSNLSSGFNNHPSDVCPPEALVSRVRVELGVGISVVCSVTSRPPFDRALNRTGTSDRQEVLEGYRGVVSSVGP